MKMAQIVLLLLLVVLTTTSTGYPSGPREKHASWDEVNVVAHGLLQLGQALKEHVDKSKAQIREVNAGLKNMNLSLTRLEQDQALKTKKISIGEQLAEDVRNKIEGMEESDKEMNLRMERLEEKVEEVLNKPTLDSNYSDDAEMPFAQRLMAAQNRRIDQLMEKIKQQQDKLEKQSLHLQALQSKVGQKRKSHRRRHEDMQQRDGQQTGLARDCHELFVQGQRISGVYTIQPENSRPFSVFCEMTSEGGWTVIQKRFDGSQNFDQAWDSYKKGFGSLNGEFWLGLSHLHALSKQGQYTLQVEVSDWSNQKHVTSYDFLVDGEAQKFALHLNPVSEDTLFNTGASGLPFTTADRDNDMNADDNCAQMLSGGWWFSSCGDSNLNGEFESGSNQMFFTTTEGHTTLQSTVMKMAPASLK